MASAKYGAIITDMKGKIGGTVFKGTKQGSVVQNKGNKITKADASRTIASTFGGNVTSAKRAMALASGSWRNLTALQQAAWVAAAPSFPFVNKYGAPYTPSGYQLYVAMNISALSVGSAQPAAPPAVEMIDPTPALSQELTGPDVLKLAYDPVLAADYVFQIFATAPISPGRAFEPGLAKQILQIDNGTASPVPLDTAYAAVFGAVPASGYCFIGGKITKADAYRSSAPVFIPFVW